MSWAGTSFFHTVWGRSALLIDEFFLVPYFGACIHVPPPPPNQIVYVKMRAGAGLRSIEDAQWVTGILRVAVKTSALGAATYTLEGERMEPYRDEGQ